MATIAEFIAKVGELPGAVQGNADRTAKEIADLQTALNNAKAEANIPDDVMAKLQAAIDALNA